LAFTQVANFYDVHACDFPTDTKECEEVSKQTH